MRFSIIMAFFFAAICLPFAARCVAQESRSAAQPQRTAEEVQALIDQQGRQPPAWWDSVELNYPQTLDLSWPTTPPRGGWNAQRNVGQFIWDVINTNPNRWREGIRLVHQLLLQHQKDEAKAKRDMRELGNMYYRFEQDYARAAFWWQHAGVEGGTEDPRLGPLVPKLADCYWKLGCKKLAYDTLRQGPYYMSTIKVLADMGETDIAVGLAERFGSSSRPDLAFLYAGDACRQAGRYEDAIAYYDKVLQTRPSNPRFQKAFEKSKRRARSNVAAINVYDRLDLSRIPDGTYHGSAPSYAGDLEVKVVIRGGRITDAAVTRHKDKQFYSAITDMPRQIVEKQGVKGVDAITGATITSEAIVNAVAQALAGAQQ